MNSRIRLILNYKGITATEFANAIGVQPSNVSHVLNGRNNPSQPFIEKILSFYPEINARWLLLGEGSMLDNDKSVKTVSQPNLFYNQEVNIDDIHEKTDDYKCNIDKSTVNPKESLPIITEEKLPTRKIERIVTFYSDQTFEEYYPRH